MNTSTSGPRHIQMNPEKWAVFCGIVDGVLPLEGAGPKVFGFPDAVLAGAVEHYKKEGQRLCGWFTAMMPGFPIHHSMKVWIEMGYEEKINQP